ncbi:hypothetical protein J7355_00985 [Endozoicomonas sp. G2_2]|uniref:hypothetical protein n=1 Tax=Endozoicomonas sp. G2_2 TaxID=2821092 RepID=UPI001ADB3FF2|nr:hypothetical protein [Endozoicomonas sp. G2_2]MBO9468663.1 hypothetical protein [Endozoicomonas sp. G2_2]
MSLKFPFVIVKFKPGKGRGEALNVGLLALKDERVDLRLGANYSRKLILKEYGALDEFWRLSENLSYWISLFSQSKELLLEELPIFPRWAFSQIGYFYANTSADYEAEVQEILADLVSPLSMEPKISRKRRLLSSFRHELEKIDILGDNEQDFKNGYMVPKVPIKIGGSTLSFDFGAHSKEIVLIQTLDLSVVDLSNKIKDASLKAISFDRAQSYFERRVRPFFLVRWPEVPNEWSDTCYEIMHAYSDKIVDFDRSRSKIEFLSYLSKFRPRSRDLFAEKRNSLASRA